MKTTIKNVALALGLTTTLLIPAQAQQKPAAKKMPAAKVSAAAKQAVAGSKLDRSKKPGAAPAPAIQLAKAEQFTLPNGLKVFVVSNRKLPRLTYSLVLDYDPILEGASAGYVELAGELIGTGTKTRTKDQLNEEVDFLGADLSTGSSSAYVSGLSRHKDKLMELFSDVILNPSLTQEEFDKLKKQKISALQADKNDPDAIADRVTARLIYGENHPYGEFATEETVKNLGVDKARNFYNTYWKPEVGYLAIVGDITSAEAHQLVDKYLSKWQKGNVPKAEYPLPKEPEQPVIALVDRPSAVQSLITIAQTAPLKPNSPDAIQARLMNDVLGGGASARLFNNLREKKGYTYGAYSSLRSDKVIGQFEASASVRNAVTDSAVQEFLNELKRISAGAVEEDEMTLSRNSLSGNFVMSLEQPSTIATYAINTARYNLPPDYYANYLKMVEGVKGNDVQGVAAKYVRPNKAYIVVVGKAAEVAPKLARFGKVQYFNDEGKPVAANTTKAVPAGVTAQTVLDKYIQAVGGRKVVEKVQDLSASYKATIGPNELVMDIYNKAPNMAKQVIAMKGNEAMKMVCNGKEFLTKQMGQASKSTGEELKDKLSVSAFNWELNPQAAGIKMSVLGIEQLDGKDAYKVEASLPSGKKDFHYFDVASGLRVQYVTTEQGPEGPVESVLKMGDYKDVGLGYMVPSKLMLSFGPMPISFSLAKAEVNTKLKDSVFEVK